MKVSRSGFYVWLGRCDGGENRQSSERQRRRERVKAVFQRHGGRYGSRRLKAELAAEGENIGRFQIRSLMKAENLRAIQPRRFVPRTTDSSHGCLASPNLLSEAANQPSGAGQVIIGDITYLPLQNGSWCYLAIWQDKLTRRIVGWAVSARLTDEFVIAALRKAILGGWIKPNAIIHTDRGSQYVSRDFRSLLKRHDLRQSMSGKGNCYDNAQAESFFSRFKTELVEDGLFESVEQAGTESFDYIEVYYNRVRRHSSLGYLSPEEFEKELKRTEKGQRMSFVSIST